MNDQGTINVVGENVKVRPEAIRAGSFLLNGSHTCQFRTRENYSKLSPGEEAKRFNSTIEIFADRALKLHCRSKQGNELDPEEQFVSKIELNLRKIAYGHNGFSFKNSEEISSALAIAMHALSGLLEEPERVYDLIPGLGGECSYWKTLEVALDIRDPDYAVLSQMRYMKSPFIRVEATHYPNSVYLNGTNLTLKAYDKVAQMSKKFSNKKGGLQFTESEITRLEACFDGKQLRNFFKLGVKDQFGAEIIGGHRRITSFNWSALKNLHRAYFQDLKGVYSLKAGIDAKTNEKFVAVFAALVPQFDIPIKDIREKLEKIGGKSSDSSGRLVRQMRDYLAQTSEVTSDVLLSDEAYENPPFVGPKEFGGTRFYVDLFGDEAFEPFEAELLKVYGDKVPAGYFIPRTSLDFWKFGSDDEIIKNASLCCPT